MEENLGAASSTLTDAAAPVAATGLGGAGALPAPDSVQGLIDARRSDSGRIATVP